MNKCILLFLFASLVGVYLNAQTFKAGAYAGLTASQIDGDDDLGFNKPGIEGGLRIHISLSEKIDVGLELQYSQRGSKEGVDVDGTPQVIYQTDYVAVPVILNYKDWAAEDYYRIHFHAGLSYGRLVNAQLNNGIDNTRFIDLWRENDLSVVLGASYFLNEHFGLTFRYNRSLFLLYRNTEENAMNGGQGNSLAPYHLSFHALYMF